MRDNMWKDIMPNSINGLTQALRTTRESRGISQAALGDKVGAPQSYISKVENGGVDLQTSTLVELARALELELILVPRSLLPAVTALQLENPQSSGDGIREQAIRNLGKATRLANELRRRFPASADLQALAAALRDLKRVPMSNSVGRQMKVTLEGLYLVLREIQRAARSGSAFNDSSTTKKLSPFTRILKSERNALVHNWHDGPEGPVPAYRLRNDDDG
jgi:transcriptional regulator with XRE-family HTH domain